VCWLRAWQHAAGATFVQAYLNNLGEHALLPKDDAQLGLLLDAYLLQKAIYTVNYELNHRPQWLPIALRCLLDLVARRDDAQQAYYSTVKGPWSSQWSPWRWCKRPSNK
jgi:predicted trehalose synthase